MKRAEFMRQLESLLQNIPAAEREEALQYYNNYFDDAGGENEQEVIEALGSPARVAENIRRDLLENGYGEAASGKALASDHKLIEYEAPGSMPPPESRAAAGNRLSPAGAEVSEGAPLSGGADGTKHAGDAKTTGERGKPGKGIPGWLIAIIVIFASPMILSVGGTLIMAVVTWFMLILGFGMAALGCFIALVALAAVGVMCMSVDPMSGVALIGVGLICGSIGILFLMLAVFMGGFVTPAIFRGIAFLCRKVAHPGQV